MALAMPTFLSNRDIYLHLRRLRDCAADDETDVVFVDLWRRINLWRQKGESIDMETNTVELGGGEWRTSHSPLAASLPDVS